MSDAIALVSVVVEEPLDAPWDEASMELFAAVASESPGVLTGRWRVLFDLVHADLSLWKVVKATVGEIEDGLVPNEPPVIDRVRLRERWPALIATVFAHPAPRARPHGLAGSPRA